jgi:hypothetical protein
MVLHWHFEATPIDFNEIWYENYDSPDILLGGVRSTFVLRP